MNDSANETLKARAQAWTSLRTLDHMINSFAGTTTMHALLLQPPRTYSNAHSEGGEPQLAVMPTNALFVVRTTKAKQVLSFGVS